MSEHIELEVKGSTDFSGRVAGQGRLTLQVSDAASASVGVDYRNADRLLLSLESTAGLRLSADDTLTLSGGLTHDLLNQELGGRVRARLKIDKRVSASLEQRFDRRGPATSVELRITL